VLKEGASEIGAFKLETKRCSYKKHAKS